MTRKASQPPVIQKPRPVAESPNPDIKNQEPDTSSGGILGTLQLLFTMLPAVFLFRLIGKYADNIPIKDDYEAILNFLIKYKLADIPEKISLCFSLHSEHRIVTSRVLYVLWYELTGTTSFEAFIYIGNLMLVPIFLICAQFIRHFTPKYWYIPAIVMAMLIFDPIGYENNFFAMAGIANFGIIMYFMLSLYFYNKSTGKALVAGIICQVLCIYSNGNGIIGAFVIVLTTFFLGDRKKMIIAGTVFLIFSALYFVCYEKPDNVENLQGTISQIIPFYIRIIGSHFLYEQSFVAGLAILLLLVICFPISKKLVLNKKAVPLISILCFALLSMAVAAVFRSGADPLHSYTSRYFIYNKFITGIVFCFLFYKIIQLNRKIFWGCTLALSALFIGLFSYGILWGEGGIRLEKRRKIYYEYYYKDHKVKQGVDDEAKKITDEACALNIYCIDENREDATWEDYYP